MNQPFVFFFLHFAFSGLLSSAVLGCFNVLEVWKNGMDVINFLLQAIDMITGGWFRKKCYLCKSYHI